MPALRPATVFPRVPFIAKKSKVATVPVPILGNDRSAHAIHAGRHNAPATNRPGFARIAFPHVGRAARKLADLELLVRGDFCDETSLEGDACARGMRFDCH